MTLTLGIDARLANAPQRAGVGNFCRGVLGALPAVMGDTQLRLYLDAEPAADLPARRHADIRVLPPGRFWTHRILARELRRDPPGVFWSPVLQLPLGVPCPLAATIYDLAVRRFPRQFTWRRRLIARIELRLAAWRAACLCAVSEASKADLRRYYRVPADCIWITRGGVDDRFHYPQPASALTRVHAAHDLPEHFVLYVGRIQPRKNLVRLIDAFARVCEEHPALPHELIIAGDAGWLDAPIYAHAKASSARDRIRFLGFVADGDLPPLMAAADVLALVSLWEGFGLPVVEAMACGTAVLTSNCSSLPEVAGDAAHLADPADTAAIADGLARLLTDGAYRHALERRGTAQAARFTWNAAAAHLMQAVRTAAEMNHKGAKATK
ncbi:MAG: glycosyltransferase family 4 protein [Candidatus Hydrogenedentota bacterium]